MIIVFGAAGCSAPKAERLYGEKFPNRHHLNRKRLISIHRNLRETGSFKRQRAGQSARHRTVQTPAFEEMVLDRVTEAGQGTRHRTVRTPACEEMVLDHVTEAPSKSTHQLPQELQILKGFVWKVLKEQLLHPYLRLRVQAMGPADLIIMNQESSSVNG